MKVYLPRTDCFLAPGRMSLPHPRAAVPCATAAAVPLLLTGVCGPGPAGWRRLRRCVVRRCSAATEAICFMTEALLRAPPECRVGKEGEGAAGKHPTL